jgi:hypothetical protein
VHISKTLGPFLKKRMQERRQYTPLWDFTQTRDKVARSASLRGRMQQKKVFLHPVGRVDVEPEFLAFPAGRHDDLVDAGSCGMLMLETLMKAHNPAAPPPPGPPEWSMEWIKGRIQETHNNERNHVPRKLNGKPRTPKKKASTWS